MVRQVRLTERVVPMGGTSTIDQRVFAFGTHPLADASEVHPVTSAAARGNKLRVIMDELLVGNYLEEIQCRAVVDTDAFGRVPLPTTPDDVANCATGNDVLPQTCVGAGAVCLCERDEGCIRETTTVPKGQPVGVLDINQDGATDDTQFILGSVGIRCGSIDVPMDVNLSYWNPSGDQNRPAQGGFDALGPAVVLVPDGALPTNIECGLTFADNVVDKSGNRVCIPANGDVNAGCSPGDVGAFKFKVEPLSIVPVGPEPGAMNVSTTDPLLFEVNAPVDLVSVGNITATPALPPYDVTIMDNTLILSFTAPLQPGTTYTVTVPVTVTDAYGQPLAMPVTYMFTTAA